MPSSDILEILLAHDQWATGQILASAEKLTPEQFHQRFDIGPGSLHDTITHMLGAMRAWTQTLAEQPPGPRLEHSGPRSAPELSALLDTCTREFSAEVHRRPLDEIVTRVREGKTYQFSRGVIVTHVATHGMHHRAQCLNMLRHLGSTLPHSSVAEWSWTV